MIILPRIVGEWLKSQEDREPFLLFAAALDFRSGPVKFAMGREEISRSVLRVLDGEVSYAYPVALKVSANAISPILYYRCEVERGQEYREIYYGTGEVLSDYLEKEIKGSEYMKVTFHEFSSFAALEEEMLDDCKIFKGVKSAYIAWMSSDFSRQLLSEKEGRLYRLLYRTDLGCSEEIPFVFLDA